MDRFTVKDLCVESKLGKMRGCWPENKLMRSASRTGNMLL